MGKNTTILRKNTKRSGKLEEVGICCKLIFFVFLHAWTEYFSVSEKRKIVLQNGKFLFLFIMLFFPQTFFPFSSCHNGYIINLQPSLKNALLRHFLRRLSQFHLRPIEELLMNIFWLMVWMIRLKILWRCLIYLKERNQR